MDIQNLVKLVVEHYQQSPRGPYKVTQALSKVKQDSATSTQRIILDTSELAWRAFFAAKKAADSNHGFRGQAELARLLNILSTQATEDRQDFAQQLAHALEGADLQLTSQVEDTRPRPGPKRRCTATETEMPSPTTSDNVANSSTTSYIDVELYHSQRSPENRNLQGLHVNASLQASKTLFPPEFMDSIERIPHSWRPDILAADVSMILQKGYIREHFGCQMEIGIAKEKVPFYAKRLFDIEVETKDGVRYIRGPHGSKIEPQPSIKLRGCPQDAISGVFGNTLSAGISSGPIYQREVKEARDHTDGVSMTITNKGVEAGKITLFLGEWYAYTIKKELYD